MPPLFTLSRWLIFLIRSAADVSHPRQQGNPRAGTSAAIGLVNCDIINGLSAGEDGTGGNPLLSPRMATGAVPGSIASASVPLSSGRSVYLPTQSQKNFASPL